MESFVFSNGKKAALPHRIIHLEKPSKTSDNLFPTRLDIIILY